MRGGMAGGGGAGGRRLWARWRCLRALLRDTQRALNDVTDILDIDPEVSIGVQELADLSSRCAALVILGSSPEARARLLHCLLGRRLLPEPAPRGCRWLRIQYGSTTQVHLTLGNSEFELVEDLECNKRPWDTLPLQDLLRQDPTDLSTVLEIELNNSFLKDGLKIIVPPDLPTDTYPTTYHDLKQSHLDFYTKREQILKTFNPTYLFAMDKIGRNVFRENIVCDNVMTSRSEEDFWNTFSLYYMSRSGSSDKGSVGGKGRILGGEPAVITSENCLDLHQIKEINPNAQVSFVLFSDSVDMSAEENRSEVRLNVEATESAEDTVFRTEELPESDQGLVHDGLLRNTQESPEHSSDNRRLREEQIAFMNELLGQWELMVSPPPKHFVKSQYTILDDIEIMRTSDHKSVTSHQANAIQTEVSSAKGCKDGDKVIRNRTALVTNVVKYSMDCMQSYLLDYCTRLSEIHVKLLQQFILASFDMARELQVVPKKIQYVARQEQQLYETIHEKFTEGDKKEELLQIMQDVLLEIKTEINNMDWSVDDLPCHQDSRFLSNSVFYSSSSIADSFRPGQTGQPTSQDLPSDGEEAESYDSYSFDDYEIINSNDESLSVSYSRFRPPEDSLASEIGSIRVENESPPHCARSPSACTSGNVSVKQASLDVQQTVLSKLSRKISLKLVTFVDCLKDTYFGTLQRCLESLESSCRQELGGRPASAAMRALRGAARRVQLQPCASRGLLRALLESLRSILHRLRTGGDAGRGGARGGAWRRGVALHTAHSLSAPRLAKVISAQILERLGEAHERYQAALTALETALASRLHHTEDVKLAIRKKYAPSFARLCLESTSMCDLLMYGMPELGREIGRGQYGVVYSVRGSWGGHSPVAVKSVLPADERHYHELAMEFFYTRSIPAHPRIVSLHGSLLQRGAAGPGVLLLSARRRRDLHGAVRAGLRAARRLRVACDIVQGIRYLHSLGLVHRDIKMKNVLLDADDRAALSDLGFCAAEALISGSVVGTPVHMAPELLAGEYDASVDVYAFGILFWYVCAGNIKLPSAFEMFQNKEQLWSKVKRGLRPERLPHFTDECWEVMQACWASEPSQRALLGDIQPKLERILEQALKEDQDVQGTETGAVDCRDSESDDSLEMTGVERSGM